MKTIKKRIEIFFTLLTALICCLTCALILSGCSSKELSLEDYKNIDYSFLSSYGYGQSKEKEAVAIFDTVEELQESTDKSITENSYVRVKGYYASNDLGGACYVISKETSSAALSLKNGLYAKLVADKLNIEKQEFYVLNVKQFGAKTDGITATQTAINDAVAYINENLDGNKTILYLPAGEYRADNEINANDLKNVIITGDGDDTVIFTDNGYKSWWEFFFACWRDDNCFFGNFKIEARESWGQNKYFRQITLIDCNNCYLYNLTLNVPETAWTGETFDKVDSKGNVVEPNSFDKQYTNLTMYSGDKNITVDGCTMFQMSGTYRGANVGIMDFYERGTENIIVKNCELHDNARDEQVGIFTKSGAENSKITNVNFINNKVFTYPTPYKSLIGGRTLCFTVAYDNEVNSVNIEGNEFETYTDSKFMAFGSVKNCTVKNNKISVHVIDSAGYFFDSSCKEDGDVLIEDNDLYFTYVNNPLTWKCVSAGHLTFRNNDVVAACTIYKISERLGIYENNNFQMLYNFRTCGSATKFNRNTVVSYGQHYEQYNKMFFIYSGDPTYNENTVLEFVGNTITDYTYYNGAKNQKVFDALGEVNNVTIKELRITDNEYNCPNYRYLSSDDYIWICWVRSEAHIDNFICKNNDLQGAKVVYGADGGNNTLREFNTEVPEPNVSEIKILYKGEETDEIKAENAVTLTSDTDNVNWFILGDGATVENGTVTCDSEGTCTVFAAATDGSGAYTSVTIQFDGNTKGSVNIVAIVVPIICVIIVGIVITLILLHIKRKKSKNEV